MKKYDYLIVGAGLFGATLANRLADYGKSVLVVEKKPYVGGMCYTEKRDGITVHKFGAHIFRTNEDWVWKYVNHYAHFKPFINSPLAYVDNKMYNLPFNMNTFQQLWGVTQPKDAREQIMRDCVPHCNPQNLEEYALSKVGKTIYYKFIKDYTEKQWGKDCKDLPASILGRLPLRFTYDNNYYSGKQYQGIPEEGYTEFIKQLLSSADVWTNVGDSWRRFEDCANTIIYTGSIDEFYSYKYGELEYRSLKFDEYELDEESIYGNAVINFPEEIIPYTRQIEHKFFLGEKSNKTIISIETPCKYDGTNERYYPVITDSNIKLANKYFNIDCDLKNRPIFAGRLGSYQYTDMEQTIVNAFRLARRLVRE